MTCVPGGWQPLEPEIQPSPASRPLSPVLNQHFCSPSSVPQTHHSHSGKDKHLCTGLYLHCHKLVRAHAVVQEASNGCTIALEVCEQCLPSVPDHGVLLLARRPLQSCSTDHASCRQGNEPARGSCGNAPQPHGQCCGR